MAAHNPPAENRKRTGAQKAATVLGAVSLLAGVFGFIPGLTGRYDQMAFAGNHSEAMLLGIFQVSILHNIVHLLFGLAGLATAGRESGARSYLVIGGILYLILSLHGLVTDDGSAANFVPYNNADNWLHLFLGIVMVALGLLLTVDRDLPRHTTP